LKQCKHQNIVAYYGTYTKQQELWIIMDYCGAGSLKDVLTLTGCRLDNEAMV
jgi:serine/threonine protein kinase